MRGHCCRKSDRSLETILNRAEQEARMKDANRFDLRWLGLRESTHAKANSDSEGVE